MTSVSTRFFGQPRLTKPIFKVVDPEENYIQDSRATALLELVKLASVVAQDHAREFQGPLACDFAVVHHFG